MRAFGLLCGVGLVLVALASLLSLAPVSAQTDGVSTASAEATETPAVTATIDPCLPSNEAGEGTDPCATATEETPVKPEPTPTLEYEIDVPVWFFPTATIVPENEETAAAIETAQADESVTSLPNTGGSGPGGPSYGLAVVLALAALLGSMIVAARSRARG
ncbi:MAG: hypothetical protein M3Y37_05545 [Chloroflexota bacterium]|nr:hypothetical protein [Chloroflexota bacterium]